jgi:hypothetical protein
MDAGGELDEHVGEVCGRAQMISGHCNELGFHPGDDEKALEILKRRVTM